MQNAEARESQIPRRAEVAQLLGVWHSGAGFAVTCLKRSSVYVLLSRFSRVRLFAIPGTVVYQASLSMGFSRQEYCSGLSFPTPGDLPHPWSPGLAGVFFPIAPPGKPFRN